MIVKRGHPLKVSLETPVASVQIQASRFSSIGQIAKIFPNRAELTALNQSSSITVEHGLSRDASRDLEKEAVLRARERETSFLLHDLETNMYTLVHPTLAHGDPAAFPIEISSLEGGPEIRILSPYESDKSSLISLELATKQLTITSDSIGLPSIYIMDTLLSAMLCLLLHLQLTTLILEPHFSMPPSEPDASLAFEPPPTSPFRDSPTQKRSNKESSRTWLSLRSRHVNDIETQERLWTDTQLDLSHFYPFTLEDQSLSHGTRVCLKLLYWCFEALVWIGGSFVGILAAGIVSMGSRMTSP